MPLGTAVLNLRANVQQFQASMAGASTSLRTLQTRTSAVTTGLNQMGIAAMKMGAALTAALAPAVVQGAKFEKQMAAVKAVMADTQGESSRAEQNFAELTETARRLGATTQFTATQVAEAMQFLGLAGFTAKDALAGIEDTLNLAAAGMLDLGRASDLATDTMTAFSIAAEDLDRVVDVFAQTATNSNTSVEQLGESMKLVAPSAASLGQSLEMTSTALGVLANSGLKASVSGAGLAQAFAQLAKKGEDANKVLAKYGITIDDVNPELVSIRDIIARFEEVNLSAGDAMDLFGARAGRMILALKQQGVVVFDALFDKINNAAGAAERMANIRMDTTAGDFLKLKSAIEGLSISIFEAIQESLRDTVAFLVRVVGEVKKWVDENQELVGMIAKVVAVAGVLLTVVGGLATVLGIVSAAVAGFVAVGAEALAIAAAISLGILELAGVIAAVLVPVIIAMQKHWAKIQTILQKVWESAFVPFIEGMKIGFTTVMDKILRPLQDMFNVVFEMILFWLQVTVDQLGGWEQAFNIAGQAVVIFAGLVAGLGLIIMSMIGVLVIGVAGVVAGVVAAISWIGRLFGLLGSAKGSDALEEEAEAAAKLDEELRNLNDTVQRRNKESLAQTAQDKKALQLMERFDKLSIVELKNLQKLTEAGALNRREMESRLTQRKKDIAALEAQLASENEYSEAEKKRAQSQLERLKKLEKDEQRQIERLDKIDKIRKGGAAEIDSQVAAYQKELDTRQQLIENLQDEIEARQDAGLSAREQQEQLEELLEAQEADALAMAEVNAMNREHADIMASVGGDVEAYRIEIERRAKVTKEARDATDSLADSEKKFRDMQEDLVNRSTNALGSEIATIEKLLEERKKLLETRRLDIKAALAGLELRIKNIKAYTDETEKAKQLNAALEEKRKLEGQLAETNQAQADAEKAAAEDVDAVRKKQAAKRKDFLRKQEIDDLRKRNKFVEAQRLENQAILEEEKKKNDELFAMDGQNDAEIARQRQQAEANQAREAEARMKAARERQAGGATGKVAEQEADLEKKVTDQLVKRVTSVRELIQLYNVLWRLRQQQEKRALEAAEKTQRMETLLANKQAARLAEDDPKKQARLDKEIARLQTRLDLETQIAAKRAGEANLVAAEGGEVPGADQTHADALLQSQEINILLGEIQLMEANMKQAFADMPGHWVNAFIGSWATESQRIVDAVRQTMAAIKVEMHPQTEHSPSLIQTMDANVKAVREGMNGMNAAVGANMPHMGKLSMMNAAPVQPIGMSTGGFSGGTQAKEFNDNRTVKMDITNNVDIDNFKRQVARSLVQANMRSGEL